MGASGNRKNAIVRNENGSFRSDDNGNLYAKRNKETKKYELMPNVNYQLNGYSYKTDNNGNLIYASGFIDLPSPDHKRKAINDKPKGMVDGDERTHIFADIFNGSNLVGNIIPASFTINRVQYRKMENELVSMLKKIPPPKIFVEVSMIYNKGCNRPDILSVSYSLNGSKRKVAKMFINTPERINDSND